ncbi:nucleoside hydrolase [Paenibacillus yanchengensis]|uniref:Nucleoside hydrolase n=1 Tax=Paenibacillus yanchengensis TaxID=2035833 RepID=A0ABW4YLM6_9BACL
MAFLKKGIMPYDVPENKRLRLIVNTDAANEADDQFAIAHALLTPRFDNVGLIAAHFGTRSETSMQESYDEIINVLKLMEMEEDYQVYKGAEKAVVAGEKPQLTEGAKLIIDEAMREDTTTPLFVIFLGPITDLAVAYLLEPRIENRLTAVWIGGGAYPHGGEEFNLANDIEAANVVFQSRIPLWQVPRNVYKMVRVTIAELAVRVRPHGEIGRYLYDQLVEFNHLPRHHLRWPPGESWQLGDSPAVSLLLDDHAFEYDDVPAPHVEKDMTYTARDTDRTIRVYRSVDSRFTLEDMYAKLELFHQYQLQSEGKK